VEQIQGKSNSSPPDGFQNKLEALLKKYNLID
jgi:hypothetical protein